MIKQIKLYTENCEIITFPGNVIGDFHMGSLYSEINRYGSNSIHKSAYCGDFAIELFAVGDTPHHQFGFESKEYTTTKFKRLLRYSDLTHIDVIFENGDQEYYSFEYDEGEKAGLLGAENIRQKTKTSSLGNLYIVISDKELEEYFPDEEIENKEEIEFKADMYDIGVERYDYLPYDKDHIPECHRYLHIGDINGSWIDASFTDITAGAEKLLVEPTYRDGDFSWPPVEWQYYSNKVADFMVNEHYKDCPFLSASVVDGVLKLTVLPESE